MIAKLTTHHIAKRTLALVCGFMATTGMAQAALVNANATFDLSAGFSQLSPLTGGSASIANGDTVKLTVDFLGNQNLTIGDGSEGLNPWFHAGDNNSSFTINNATIKLLGFSGTGGAASTYHLGTLTGGMAHLGPSMPNFLTPGQTVTFSGIEATYDIDSIAQSPHSYDNAWLIVSGDNLRVGAGGQNVPEPASVALLGLGLAGLAVRGRKAKQSA